MWEVERFQLQLQTQVITRVDTLLKNTVQAAGEGDGNQTS